MTLTDQMLDDLANAIDTISRAGYMVRGTEDGDIAIHDPDDGGRCVADIWEDRSGVSWERR